MAESNAENSRREAIAGIGRSSASLSWTLQRLADCEQPISTTVANKKLSRGASFQLYIMTTIRAEADSLDANSGVIG